jgi:cytochrome b561
MSGSNRKFYYTVAKVLHWVAGFFIVFNLLSGWKIEDFPLAQKEVLIMIHSGIGTTIFLLMLFRWWWRRAHNLYTPPGWWKRPSRLLQWIFYPLVLIQAIIGVVQAAFIDYDVLAYGFIPYSALATADESLHGLFLQLHGLTALVLILLVICHGIERGRLAFIDDGNQMKAQGQSQL